MEKRNNNAEDDVLRDFMRWWQREYTIAANRKDGLSLWRELCDLAPKGGRLWKGTPDEFAVASRLMGGKAMERVFLSPLGGVDATDA
ncbi:MAG: hypothetical protein ABW189_03315 [Rickettsiales bacterium]